LKLRDQKEQDCCYQTDCEQNKLLLVDTFLAGKVGAGGKVLDAFICGRFSIASTKKWTDKANKTHESTDWFRVAAWGNLTKFASSLKKGDPVLVQGELRTGEYTDEKKVTRQTVELVAQTILRIDYTKLGVAEQGDAAEPEA
jgi:single-strand DNA-binding protein